MTNYLSIVVAAALVNNLVLLQFLGVSSLFYSTRRLQQAIEFSLFSFVVLFFATAINSLLYRYLLLPFDLQIFRLLLFVATGAAISTLLLRLVEKQLPLSFRQQSVLLFLSGGNSAILGATLLSVNSMFSFTESIAFSFGAALGYSLLIIAFAALRTRLEHADIPEPFQGGAILLITAGLSALGFLGFAGLS